MQWGRLPSRLADSPAVLAIGNAGIGLFARAIAYAAHHETEGHVPAAWVMATAAGDVDLVEAVTAHGLWEIRDGGFYIESVAEDQAKFEASVERNQKGGRTRGQQIAAEAAARRAAEAAGGTAAGAAAPASGSGSGTRDVAVAPNEVANPHRSSLSLPVVEEPQLSSVNGARA